MKTLTKNTLLTSLVLTPLVLASSQSLARDQIKMVGSSTVYPFASAVAEELGQTTRYPTPVVESTGSGGGLKLFCAGNGMNTPDITNASRGIKAKEIKRCAKNGISKITEATIGFDGIVLAQSKKNPPLRLSRKDILLAVAAKVPSKNGSKLIDNPYKFWDQINNHLPHRAIRIYGPPHSSGTRDAFEDMAMKHLTKKIAAYKAITKKYHKIREDGAYIPSGENDNLIVQKLDKDRAAIGIFGYSYLVENGDHISAASVAGIAPNADTIAGHQYPFSRSLHFYIKNSHVAKVPSMRAYLKLFMSEDMIGPDGVLQEIGLIPLPSAERAKQRKQVLALVPLR